MPAEFVADLYARYRPYALAVAWVRVGEDAEDVVQEAFLTAWRYQRVAPSPEYERAWVAQMVRWAAGTHRRRERFAGPLPPTAAAPVVVEEQALLRLALVATFACLAPAVRAVLLADLGTTARFHTPAWHSARRRWQHALAAQDRRPCVV